MSNKLTKEDYAKLASSRDHELIECENYTSVKSKMTFHCFKCNTIWETTGHAYKNAKKTGCPGCKKITTSETHTGKSVSESTRKKIGEKASLRPGSLTGVTGSAHPRYKNGVGRDFTNPSTEDYLWKSSVKKRCGYKCVVSLAHTSSGKDFACHHLNSFNSFPEQRYLPSNGVYLKREIHKQFHDSYGYGKNTEAQFADFCLKWHGFNWDDRKNHLNI